MTDLQFNLVDSIALLVERRLHDELLETQARRQEFMRSLRKELQDASDTESARPLNELLGFAVSAKPTQSQRVEPLVFDVGSHSGPSLRTAAVAETSCGDRPSGQLSQHSTRKRNQDAEELEVKGESVSPYQHSQGHNGEISQKLVKKSHIRSGDTQAENTGGTNCLGRLVTSHCFDAFFCVMIVCNTIFICLENQYQGLLLDAEQRFVGESAHGVLWPGFQSVSNVVSNFFGVVFTIEVVLKVGGLRTQFVRCAWNLLDFSLVALWHVDTWMFNISIVFNPLLLRLLRLLRLIRLMRLLQSFESVHCLMLMTLATRRSFQVVFWGVILLGLMIVISSIVMQSQMISIVIDPEVDFEVRQKFFSLFGTFTRTNITMFEVVLGNWIPVCRLLLEQAGEGWAFLILIFRILIGWSVVKVVMAVIMHETFKAAGMDDDLMIQTGLLAKKRFMDKMEAFLHEADLNGDGTMTDQEFDLVLQEPRVRAWLQAMDLDIHDVRDVFAYVARGENLKDHGNVDQHKVPVTDLTRGLARLRGATQACDLLAFMEEMKSMRNWEIPQIYGAITELRKSTDLVLKVAMARRGDDPLAVTSPRLPP